MHTEKSQSNFTGEEEFDFFRNCPNFEQLHCQELAAIVIYNIGLSQERICVTYIFHRHIYCVTCKLQPMFGGETIEEVLPYANKTETTPA